MSLALFLDTLLDAVKDTLNLVPFLFLTYLAMEALEHGTEGRAERVVADAGKAGPLVGGLLGALPQCGFSAMAGTLYAGRIITAGTLVAVILATSDEMIPVFVAHQSSVETMAAIIITKVIYGILVGFAVDAVLRALHRTGDGHPHIQELCERAHCHCDDEDEDEASDTAIAESVAELEASDAHEHAHGHGHGYKVWHIVRSALIHTVEVTFFIFVITLIFGLVMGLVGEDVIGEALSSHPVRAVLLAALIGLIPNCGASVMICELYLGGTLAAGPMIAGLAVSGGMGLLILFRTNADQRQNIEITAFIWIVGVILGLAVMALGVTF